MSGCYPGAVDFGNVTSVPSDSEVLLLINWANILDFKSHYSFHLGTRACHYLVTTELGTPRMSSDAEPEPSEAVGLSYV